MPVRRVPTILILFAVGLVLFAGLPCASSAQESAAASAEGKALTIERIYSQPSLSGRLTRGVAWSPDGKQLSFFESKGTGKDAKTELWVMEVPSGERRLLVPADKLESVLPAESGRATQATGLGRRASAQYQWAPGGNALLFEGPNSLAWFDLKSQTARTLVWGKESIAERLIGGRRTLRRSRIWRWMNARFRNTRWWSFPRTAGKRSSSDIPLPAAPIPQCA